MRHHVIDLIMPTDMADTLVREGVARPTFGRRSTALQILAETASVASVTISLLQGPATVAQVAHGIKRWAREHRKSAPGSDRLTIVRGERTNACIVDGDTHIEIIIEILQHAILSEKDQQPPEDFDDLTI
jgi:hypothetical protein